MYTNMANSKKTNPAGVLLAVDPGADPGWSRFDLGTKRLQACGLNWSNHFTNITEAIIEFPMIYPGGRQKARPADVIKLAIRAGEWGGMAKALWQVEPRYVTPHDWKGSVDKNIHHPRIWGKLTAEEQAIVSAAAKGVAPSKRHNILDAIGLGLFGVGRAA